MLKRFLIVLIAGGLVVLISASAAGGMNSGLVWTNFYGSATLYNGNPIPVGSIIDAYDTSGIHCGCDTVHTRGQYGFMPVLGDDGYGGEGPEAGEVITFYINGRLAIPQGPDDPVWVGLGARVEVNLSAAASVSMMMTSFPGDQDAVPGGIVRYYATIQNTGQGTDFYTVSAISQHGWIIEPMSELVYALADEYATVYFDILIPYAIFYDTDDEVTFRVISGADTLVFVEDTAVTHVKIPTDAPEDNDELLPSSFELYQNYPNPFNPTTIISFNLSVKADVELEVFNLLGRMINRINLGNMNAGYHSFEYEAGPLASGVYFYRVKAGEKSDIKKMLLMK